MPDLKSLVIDKITEMGPREASKYFGVSAGTISNWGSGKTSPSVDAVEQVLAEKAEFDWAPTKEPVAELTQWEGKQLIMLLPVYRTFSADTHFTLFANYAKYGPEKIGMIQEKRTIIYEARNILVHKWLTTTDAPFGLFCDDDMILPCGNSGLFNDRYGAKIDGGLAGKIAISQIMSHGADKRIVGALYFGRQANGKAQCASGFFKPGFNKEVRTRSVKGLYPDEWVGTGFMRIHRSVFAEMDKAIEEGKWPECKPVKGAAWTGYFTPLQTGMGEDVSFCRRAREIGIQTYVDMDLICLHNGELNYGPNNTKGE